mmetsp:Transcript_30498/g.41476  ORF Transcript_30498/g.41476 Transcript_30498/m.41476 type:complete len:211 (-) Transcript_30498:157-789(-)|eukprot:CAMPEP_0176364950 /NCGR_PEP_ID=MMETSP0126-20121128/20135_1 /TAXON_ID=141414 ORGANISM="Strombidinopsis acuminatum, Strain SPMC142" /NCGR_SAMPLE_ID=MMETSP0126 /ASSEMBLY_ACC=CAM_ASM_000229 /LENGTH=210 /DNA_ID=CAMNT_0017721769 /DNA_START=252 /DNA_END=884 /DNA_ORIENTATION=+
MARHALCLGGDHSVSSSSVLASMHKHPKLKVIWIDAHPDIHTYNSSVSGNTHGMPLSIATGLEKKHWASRMNLRKLDFEDLVYVGIRDIDEFEGQTIKENNIKHYSVDQVLDYIRKVDEPIHISFDIDALDPSYVSSTGTRVANGLHPDEVRIMIEEACVDEKLVSLDVVEFNGELGDPVHSMNSVREVFKEFFQEADEEEFDFSTIMSK